MPRADLSAVTAVVLAGGLGTRLRTVVSDRSKVVAEINGRPFLAYLLDQLAAAGVKDAILCTGYHGEHVQQTLGDHHATVRLRYSQEQTPLGTGGAVRAAIEQIDSPLVLVLNGDSYCRADLPAFATWHAGHPPGGSLLLASVADTSRFGRVTTDAADRVLEFAEKGAHTGSGWINAGIYLLDRTWIAAIPTSRPVSLEHEMFPAWIATGLYGCRAGGAFLDIGTPESYAAAERFFAAELTP